LELQKAKIVTAVSNEEFEKEYQNMIDTLNKYDVKLIDEAYDAVYKEYCKNKGDSTVDVNAALYK
jgi:putative aldouronate transport system substrate-binding protein